MARNDPCACKDDCRAGRARRGYLGNEGAFENDRNQQRQHAVGADVAVAHDRQAALWIVASPESIGRVGEAVFMQSARHQNMRADGDRRRGEGAQAQTMGREQGRGAQQADE